MSSPKTRIHTQLLSTQDQPTYWQLLQQVHHRSQPQDYPLEYPLVFEPSADAFSVGARLSTAQTWQAHVGVLRRTLCFGTHRLRVALIGSVATLPAARGQGLASACLQAAHQTLLTEDIGLAFLWSEPRPLYQQLGYHSVGALHVMAGGAEHLSPQPSLRVRWVLPTELVHARAPDLEGFATLARAEHEHRRLLQLPRLEVWLGEDAQQQQAVVLVGKGSDLPDLVHEWSGSPALLPALMAEVQRQRGRLGLLVPPAAPVQNPWWSLLGPPRMTLPQAQAVVLERELLLRQLATVLPAETLLSIRRELSAFPPLQQDRRLLQRLFGLTDEPGLEQALWPLHFWSLDCI